ELQNGLQLEKQAISYFLFDPLETPDPAKLISYYEDLWKNDEIEYVLTSLDEVANALLEKDITSRTITLPNYNLLKDVKKDVELTELNQAQNKQIVIGNIIMKELEGATNSNDPYKDELLSKLTKIIKRFAKRTDATVIHNADQAFTVIGTDKLLHHLRNHYRDFPLLREMKTSLKLPI